MNRHQAPRYRPDRRTPAPFLEAERNSRAEEGADAGPPAFLERDVSEQGGNSPLAP